MMTKTLIVEMLSTGDEVLHGQIIDTNAAWLSDYLFEHGLPLTTRSTTGDNLQQLVKILQLRSQFADILIVNGGLGPTSDDLSAEAAALAVGVELEERPEWLEKMRQWFAKRQRQMAESNRKQALLPKGAELIDNPVGSACGFSLLLNGCLLFFTPGVPSEFKVMVEQQILPRLQQQFVLPQPPVCLRLTTFGRSESKLAQVFDQFVLPEHVCLGYRSASPIIEIKLTGPVDAKPVMSECWLKIKEVVGQNSLYEGVTDLPSEVARLLKDKGLTVAISEQFTAGLVTLQLHNSGASIKGSQYQCPDLPSTLVDLAKQAMDINKQYQSDLSLVVGAKTEQHVYLALATPVATYAVEYHYNSHSFSQDSQQQTITMLMLDMARRWLNGWSVVGNYEFIEMVKLEHIIN